ncbi:probable ubiquitin-conjugating enzyme E2 25 isoform X2 [Rhododendron vialii]|uniref:probable ubiquitin-conjugating enzyme E2 25 isoform X2 n=1 Tax=Rhododendron vialii TaxID=182163 RepID=UPI00265DF0B4|nr:probable ubiquitin-conjugating enzyme E2 25 isoform X2 [Rhododendron vialii]
MEPQQLTRYIPQQSKKRVFPESSSSYMDQEVVEISPPSSWSSKPRLLKQKEIIQHEVIDIDMDEDSDDIMFIDEKIGANNKRKNDDNYAVLQAHFDTIDIPPGVEAPIPWFSNPTPNEKNSAAMKSSNCWTDSSHSWGLPEPAKPGKTSASLSSSSLKTRMNTRSQPRWVPVPPSSSYAESAQNKKKSAASTSLTSGKSQMERATANFPSRFKSIMEYSKKKLSLSGSNYASNSRLDAMQPPSGMESFQGPYLRSRRNKPVDNGDVIDAKFPAKDTMSLPPGVDPYMSGWQRYDGFMDKPSPMGSGIHNSSHSPFTSGEAFYAPWVEDFAYSQMSPTAAGKEFYGPWVQNLANSQKSPTAAGKESYASWVQDLASSQESPTAAGKESYAPWVQDLATSQESPTAAGSSTVPPVATSPTESHGNDDDILKKFQLFKKFDMVQDHSDHYHSSKGSSSKQPSKSWAKKIQDEWRILEKDLPDTIFVRVYESRMDLLRAVIVGAEGTPYHDGLFFFDIFFPAGYPSVPPLVHYHAGGLRLNPNLYACGKVCLSLLNTWSGSQNEKWIPGVSTMLQVLVSIQALILNEKPYFNEPGFAHSSGTPSGEKSSQSYNETTLILSLKTMVYTMKKPPKHFEDLVLGHFCKHAQDILAACKAYMEGVQVGCLAGGGVQDVDAGSKSCSTLFKSNLAKYITVLVQTFSLIGAKDCEKFLSLAKKGSPDLPRNYY